MSDHFSDDSTSSSGILLSRPESGANTESGNHSLASSFVHEDGRQEPSHSAGASDSDVARSYVHLEGKDLEAVGHSVLGSSVVDHEGLNAMSQVQQEEKKPRHPQQQGDIVSQVSGTKKSQGPSHGPLAPSSHSPAASTALITAQEAEQSGFWRLVSPIITRETAVWLAKATAINFFLPFINGVFLGFGEICAHELAYRWGWTFSTHVVQAPGRNGQALGASHQDEKRRAGNVSGVGLRTSNSSGYAYTGSGSGVGGGLGQYENDFE